MIRFHRGNQRLGQAGDLGTLARTLEEMDDFVQASDADALHVLEAMGFDRSVLAKGIETTRLVLRGAKLLKMLDLGQGREFTRSPDGPTDDGMNEFEVKGLVQLLAELAVRAEVSGRTCMAVLMFDDELLSPERK
jgi:hypothetical protein